MARTFDSHELLPLLRKRRPTGKIDRTGLKRRAEDHLHPACKLKAFFKS